MASCWPMLMKSGSKLAAMKRPSASCRRTPRQLAQIIAGKDSPTNVPLADIQQFFSRDERQKRGEIKRKVDSFQANSPVAPPRAMVLNDTPTPHEPHVLIRGNPGRPGKQVPRQFLLVVAGQERTPFKDGSSGRLDLANSITSAENPLTRRVIANRFWMHHFGEPLVTTPAISASAATRRRIRNCSIISPRRCWTAAGR